jgi:hypothetical protein
LVWSDPEVQKLAAEFVPAADASDRIQSKQSTDADALLFQKFGGKRTFVSSRAGDGLGQGQYAVAPSGELLASCATTDAREVAAMMKAGLEKWKRLPREKRLLAEAPDPKASAGWRRWEKLYPADGLVLRVITRDLPRDDGKEIPAHFRNVWNQDYAWFTKDEARAFLPAEPSEGAAHEVPRLLVERLARFHLLDNVRALNYASFPVEAVEKARLTATVVEVDGDRVSLRLDGETRASATDPFEQGYEPKLLGRAEYDVKAGRFTSFELVAVGNRWGTGNCNQRNDDTAPAPMGVVLTMAGDSAAERLPPAFISKYGW